MHFLCLLNIGSHQGYGFSRGYVRFLDVLIHRTSIGEDSITMNTRKFFAIMKTFTMRLKVGFASKSLATFRTCVHFHHAGMLFFSVPKKTPFRLE